MVGPWTLTLLCGLLGATLVQATLSPPVVLTLGPEVIKEKLTQKLEDHDAITILQKLPLLSAMREESAGQLPLLGRTLVNSILKHILWLEITSANLLHIQVQPSVYDQELVIKIPVDMVAGFNMPLVMTLVQFHMETEAEALVRVETSEKDPGRLVLSNCSSSQGSLHISVLNKVSILVRGLTDKFMKLLAPALPQMVKTQLCPVIQAAFDDMYADLLQLVTAPVALGPGSLQFGLLSPSIRNDSIQFSLWARLWNSEAKVTKWLNNSMASLTVTTPGGAPFSLVMRQNVINALVAVILSPEETLALLDFELPDLASELKSSITTINKKAADKLGPTQVVRIITPNTPKLFLGQSSTKAAQQIILELLAAAEDLRPLFTLGIEANSEVQFYTEGDRLMLTFNDISFDRIRLMVSDMELFNPQLLKDALNKILFSLLLQKQNAKLRTGISVPIVKALGYEAAKWSVTKGTLILTPATS